MPLKPTFPGQSQHAYFDLKQLEALASAIRSDVFWAFNKTEPLSASDVAKAIGKSAQTVHYHVNELVQSGLLLQVDIRKKRSRTEALYVHASLSFKSNGAAASAEERELIHKGFSAVTRGMAREIEGVYECLPHSQGLLDFVLYNRISLRITATKAVELKRKLNQILDEAIAGEDETDAMRIVASAYMAPVLGETRNRLPKSNSVKKI